MTWVEDGVFVCDERHVDGIFGFWEKSVSGEVIMGLENCLIGLLRKEMCVWTDSESARAFLDRGR